MLKVSQPEKKQPDATKRQNGTLLKTVVKAKDLKLSSKNPVSSGPLSNEKRVKGKSVNASTCSQDIQMNTKVSHISKTNQSDALKRKKASRMAVNEHKAKKLKEDVIKDPKPTE